MKNLLKITLLFFVLNLAAQTSSKKNDFDIVKIGVFEFESESIDYGKINQNADGNRIFIFKNTGNSPIIISKIKASCGCTVASKPNKPIMPGETAGINVKYATNRVGTFSKSITVISNAKTRHKVLRIKGTVLKNEQS